MWDYLIPLVRYSLSGKEWMVRYSFHQYDLRESPTLNTTIAIAYHRSAVISSEVSLSIEESAGLIQQSSDRINSSFHHSHFTLPINRLCRHLTSVAPITCLNTLGQGNLYLSLDKLSRPKLTYKQANLPAD